jgi:hypothetical protein
MGLAAALTPGAFASSDSASGSYTVSGNKVTITFKPGPGSSPVTFAKVVLGSDEPLTAISSTPTNSTCKAAGPYTGSCNYSPAASGPTAISVTFEGPAPSSALVMEFAFEDGGTSIITVPPVAPCPAITLLPPSLPTGSPGQSYSESLTASGGAGPYTFKVSGGALPPGITLGPNGELTGKPTTSGTYEFDVTALDSNGCPGTRHFSIDVYQPVTPACNCIRIKVKIDPTLLNKKHLAPDKHDFGVGFSWRMQCSTGGSGGCKGEIEFKPPEVIAGSLPKSRGLHLSLGGVHTSICSGPCNTTTFGRFEIKLRSRDQLNKLFGRVLAFTVVTRCNGTEKRQQVNVFVDEHGVFRRHS